MVIGYSKQEKYKIIETSKEEKISIKYTVDKLAKLGYKIRCDIVIGKFFEEDTIGMYDETKDRIVLSRTLFPQSAEELENTLLEEYFHSRGKVDGRRSFVTFLIDELLNAKKENIEFKKQNDQGLN